MKDELLADESGNPRLAKSADHPRQGRCARGSQFRLVRAFRYAEQYTPGAYTLRGQIPLPGDPADVVSNRFRRRAHQNLVRDFPQRTASPSHRYSDFT